jgi:hypothetical protein
VLLWSAIDLAKYFDEGFIPDVGQGPVAFAALVGNVVAASKEIAQELVVETGCFEGAVKVVVDCGIVRVDLEAVRVLVAEEKFELTILGGLEAGGISEDGAELHVLGRGKGFEDGPLVEELHLDEFYTGENFEAGWEPVVADVFEGGRELVDDELDPELGDLMLDDEQHFVVMLGLRERALLREEALER